MRRKLCSKEEPILIELVNDGVLTIEKAAEKARMPVEEFRNAMEKANTQER